jgi:hypothetical protein
MVAIEFLTFVVVFAAVIGAYSFGTRATGKSLAKPVQPTDIWLEYRSAYGRATRRRLKIVQTIIASNGRGYVCGDDGSASRFKMFRTDRIISIATPEGEVIDTRRFLSERLGITQ